jgi:phosphoribosylaminoimidazole carboxylase PurE protein
MHGLIGERRFETGAQVEGGFRMKAKPLVSVIMGSDSDLPALQDALNVLKDFKIPTEVKIVSAHRTPEMMQAFAKTAHTRGIKVIIAAAGGAAHLPGMVASLTPLPVIGVPVNLGGLKGLDALLSIVQMPKGVPVASVAIENSYNAALLAARILAINDAKLLKKLLSYRKEMRQTVMKKQTRLKDLL